ncbi:hypothetical protein CEUSTIGMA_g698.t1 [Chlamydomonas eustigma]|uniref:Uncharacterized protein n=1 Tax=Chlamydomonas eustigma TaxID=1157962 RepID=A0A250WQV7_9CHLO|nr:hypothetical protein CEUSTIGMA_g698.t1 [Chlamydomonas eustigma]|eukprot:GAX73244.1 hypothetical protein CEUSTIGMA_g698.t1 [Chlamydomonas eustigma]
MLQGQPEFCSNSNHGDFSRLQAPISPLQPEAVVLQIPDLCLHSKRSINCFRQEQLLNLVKVIIPLEPHEGSDLVSGLQGAPAAAASIYEQGGSEAVASRDHADTNTVFYRTAPIILQDKACYFVAVSDLKDMRWNPGGFSAYAAQKIICRGAEYWYLKRAGWRCEEEMEIHSFEEERCKAHKRRRVSNFVIGIKGDQSDQDASQSRFSSGPHLQGLFSTLKRDKRKDQFFVCMDISYWECDVVLEGSQAASTQDQGLALSEEPAAKRCNSGLALQSSDSKTDLGVQYSSELDFQSLENDWTGLFQSNLQLLLQQQQSNDHQPTSSVILAGFCADMAIPGIMTEMQEPAGPGMYSQLMCQDNLASEEEKSIQLLLAIHFNVEGPIRPAPSSVATDLETTSIAGNIDINSAALFKVLLQRETKITLMDLRLPPKSSVDRQPSINIVTEGNEQVGQPLNRIKLLGMQGLMSSYNAGTDIGLLLYIVHALCPILWWSDGCWVSCHQRMLAHNTPSFLDLMNPVLKLLLMFTNHGWLGIHDACRNCRLENAKAFVAALEKCLMGDRVRVQEALYKLQNKYFVKAGGNAMLEEACQVHGYYELKQAPEDAGDMAQVLCKITELSFG